VRGQEARNYIQSLKHIDPAVVRKADTIFCQLTGDPDITTEIDGSIRLVWRKEGEIHYDLKVYKG
jgi:hypothetical protein